MTDVQKGSGNVFADIGCENPEELLIKSNILIAIETVIKTLPQDKVLEVVGMDRYQLADFRCGRLLDEFSVEQYQKFLDALIQARINNVTDTNN